jgi:hypothetical protein
MLNEEEEWIAAPTVSSTSPEQRARPDARVRRRASTVTGGSGLVPGSTEGVAGVVCGSGVSDAGGVVVCGVASLMPPQQTHSAIASAASA